MARIRCKFKNLDEAIGSILEEYRDNVTEATRQAVKVVAKTAQQEVKAGSPVARYGKKKGRYKKGWTVKEEVVDRLRTDVVIHNRTDYQLTHLLEKGHVLIRGGRKAGYIDPRVHIAPAEEHAIKNLEEAIEKIAKG